jgi:hypothetical protein
VFVGPDGVLDYSYVFDVEEVFGGDVVVLCAVGEFVDAVLVDVEVVALEQFLGDRIPVYFFVLKKLLDLNAVLFFHGGLAVDEDVEAVFELVGGAGVDAGVEEAEFADV